jgi:trehalose 6-phosphate synthase
MILDGRLINISNRLPVSLRKHAGEYRLERSSGGLATALDSVWSQQPGIWIGWAGNSSKQASADLLLARASRRRPYTLQPVELSEEEVAKFYSGFANEIIWPLFHDMPSRCNFDPDYWDTYQRVNRKYAQAVEKIAQPRDFIWVHDYHLMLTAHFMRESGVKSPNGFFLHIPFPAPDVFEKLPWREAILRGLLDFDVVGFQTERDRNNFISCLRHLIPTLLVEPAAPHVCIRTNDRQCTVGVFPISIDFDEFAVQAARSDVSARCAEIRKRLSGNLLVLGVDRMDYTKGIPERLKSFRILLRRFPELRGQITLVQVVVPSREEIPDYKDLRLAVELLVSQINGEFTQPGWVPIHYMHRNLSRHELLAYYRAADIALITPLKDGMNLVAKEFCAAQVDQRGVLIVSEFAGAASELRHGAILVNPNDFSEVAQALYTAAKMPGEEKRSRMQLLRQIVKDHNVQRWTRSFLQAAATVPAPSLPGSGSGGLSEGIAAAASSDPTPGVALVASSAPSPSIFPRLAWGDRGTSRPIGMASGDD